MGLRLAQARGGVCNMGQPKGHSLADWSQLADLAFPDPADDHRFAHIEAALEQAGDRYVIFGCGFTFFERMHYLRGFENLLADLHLHPVWVHELAERVLAYPLGLAQEIGERYRGQICFESLCDIQTTLPRGTAAEIVAEA